MNRIDSKPVTYSPQGISRIRANEPPATAPRIGGRGGASGNTSVRVNPGRTERPSQPPQKATASSAPPTRLGRRIDVLA